MVIYLCADAIQLEAICLKKKYKYCVFIPCPFCVLSPIWPILPFREEKIFQVKCSKKMRGAQSFESQNCFLCIEHQPSEITSHMCDVEDNINKLYY